MAAKQTGWVSIYRSIAEHWLWQDKPFSKGQAWVDLILLASHEDSEKRKRGMLLTSLSVLCARWGWSQKKVRIFLTKLQADGMITVEGHRQGHSAGSCITLANYSRFQNTGHGKGQKKGQLYNNNNKEDRQGAVFPAVPSPIDAAEYERWRNQ